MGQIRCCISIHNIEIAYRYKLDFSENNLVQVQPKCQINQSQFAECIKETIGRDLKRKIQAKIEKFKIQVSLTTYLGGW